MPYQSQLILAVGFNEAPANSPGKGGARWCSPRRRLRFNEAPANSPGKVSTNRISVP